MGSVKHKSEQDARTRSGYPAEEQVTLLTCPACGGNGRGRTEEDDDGGYKILMCAWCGGTGSVTREIHAAFNRWMRIYALNRARNGCR